MTQITTQGVDMDEGTPQWLTFTFNKKQKMVLSKLSLQQAITEEPKKTKKAKTINHLSRTSSGEVIVNIMSPMEA